MNSGGIGHLRFGPAIAIPWMLVELAMEDPGMHVIASWPMLSVLAGMSLSSVTLADSRSRSVVNWVVLPILIEGAILHFYYMNLP
ncbi:MAG: hypothetical protein P4K97_07730 [Terracidiphilus sp.]|nr:hypothetical protein [Terracidiphilus sp.]